MKGPLHNKADLNRWPVTFSHAAEIKHQALTAAELLHIKARAQVLLLELDEPPGLRVFCVFCVLCVSCVAWVLTGWV